MSGRPCLSCGSGGFVDRGSSPPGTLCRLCGRAWTAGLLHGRNYPALSWWVEWDRAEGVWRLYETDVDAGVSREVARTRRRRTALDLIEALLGIPAGGRPTQTTN